jgi:MFS family permease
MKPSPNQSMDAVKPAAMGHNTYAAGQVSNGMNRESPTLDPRHPKGDSFGTLGETLVPLRLKTRKPRTFRERQLSLVLMCFGMLLILTDSTAVPIALPSIQREFSLPPALSIWLIVVYLIPFGALRLLGIDRRFGGKRVFIAGMIVFLLSSLACGLAQNPATLVTARILQGLGGGATFSAGLTMVSSLFPRHREQFRALALFGFMTTQAGAMGLMNGAGLADYFGWRSLFIAPVPMGVVILALAGRHLIDGDSDEEEFPLDFAGTALLTVLFLASSAALALAALDGVSSQSVMIAAGVAVTAAVGSVVTEWRTHEPVVLRGVLRARNVAWTMIVLSLMMSGLTSMYSLGALFLAMVRGFGPFQIGIALVPAAMAFAIVVSTLVPRVMRHLEPKWVLAASSSLVAGGLYLLSRLPAEGAPYALDLLPALLLIASGAAFAFPAALSGVAAAASDRERDERTRALDGAQLLGGGVGLSIPASVVLASVVQNGDSAAVVLGGFHLAFLVAAGMVAFGTLLGAFAVKPAKEKTAPSRLDPHAHHVKRMVQKPLHGAVDPDFLAIGMGATNMMAMLWSVAMGKRSVGVELRASPTYASMRWNIREDLYHHLAAIDRMMLERYGEARIPRTGDGKLFVLSDCFFSPNPESTGDARADEVINGFIEDSHIAGLAQSYEVIDDRFLYGKANRSIQSFGPAPRPTGGDPSRIGRSMREVLSERPAFQVGSQDVAVVMRRYLSEMEQMDLAAGVEPRCRVFTYHRVLPEDGFTDAPGGRKRIRIETLREMESKAAFSRIREPGTEVIDLGVPELFMIAEGTDSEDARRLGFRAEPVMIDHQDGRGRVPAQADYVIGLMTIYINSKLRRRITSQFDAEGNEYWVRHMCMGHEEDGEIGWISHGVPDYLTFDPILAGVVPPKTKRDSAEFFAGYQHLLKEYFLQETALLTELPLRELKRVSIARAPVLWSVHAKMGANALIATNGVVAGDTFGNGEFLTSGGVNTGVLGHAARVLRYWRSRAGGATADRAIRELADGIKEDTQTWIDLSLPDFAQPAKPGSRQGARREQLLEKTRQYRRSIAPVDLRDHWSRIHLFVGRLHAFEMPPPHPLPPDLRNHSEHPLHAPRFKTADGSSKDTVIQRGSTGYGRFGHRQRQRERELMAEKEQMMGEKEEMGQQMAAPANDVPPLSRSS